MRQTGTIEHFYPDGDYSFFIEKGFKFGYLRHPWRQEVWIWGDELIEKIDGVCSIIGFKKIKES